MQCTTEITNDFKPIQATIVLETQEEVDVLYSICNHTDFGNMVNRLGLDLYPIAKQLLPLVEDSDNPISVFRKFTDSMRGFKF